MQIRGRSAVKVYCSSGGGGGGGSTPNYAQQIANAANNDKGMNDRKLYGAPYRNECVAAVQKVLADAGLSQMLDASGNVMLGVDQFINALQSSGYSQTDSPVAGDIVDLSGGHVGIYLGNNQMISNGSTAGTFSWVDTPANQNAYEGNGSITYYHHN